MVEPVTLNATVWSQSVLDLKDDGVNLKRDGDRVEKGR